MTSRFEEVSLARRAVSSVHLSRLHGHLSVLENGLLTTHIAEAVVVCCPRIRAGSRLESVGIHSNG